MFNSTISTAGGLTVSLPIKVGEVTFVLGANGAGKSSLMHRLYTLNGEFAKRITAHRQNWLTSNTYDFSPQQMRQQDTYLAQMDVQDTARWKEENSNFRTGKTIYDVLDAENIRARAIALEMDMGNIERAAALTKIGSPLTTINNLLKSSNINIMISAAKNDALVAQKAGGEQFSVAELSDGERNALLIAASVLTAPPGSLLLIDEPERHLHRSITSPFLAQLFSKRDDCAFVVSTHDLSLPSDHSKSTSILVRGCLFDGARVNSWEVDILPENGVLDEEVRFDVLGGRRKLLFVEGEEQSLDKTLYSLLFPNISVISKGSCKAVETHVSALRDADQIHWIKAFGIVDRDQNDGDDIARLLGFGIYALSTYSIEGLYYHPDIQKIAVEHMVILVGGDPSPLLDDAKTAAINAVKPHVERLSARMVEKIIQNKLLARAPKWKDINGDKAFSVTIDVPGLYEAELELLRNMIVKNDLEGIVTRYPIRETMMLNQVAKHLQFKDRAQYEAAVRKLVVDDEAMRSRMLAFFGELPDKLSD